MQRKGIKVNGWWFKTRAKEILDCSHPDHTFQYSQTWFTRFKKRYRISFKRSTNTAQSPPSDKETAIQEFHQQIRDLQLPWEGDSPQVERFNLSQISNPDQTHSHFLLLTAQHTCMKQWMLQQSGFVVGGLDSKNDSALYSWPCLPMENQELNHS